MLALLVLLAAAAPAGAPDGGVPEAAATVPAPIIPAFDLRWSRVSKPASGAALVIGTPGAGCVQGAQPFPLRGAGFVLVHPERHRNFGHPILNAYLRKLAADARKAKLPTLYVGDLGQPRGGPTPTGHRSHQSGIDVDVWYGPPAGKAFTPGHAAAPAPSVVDLRTKKMLPAWNGNVARLLELAASRPEVDRIFVHASVKRALCKMKGKRGPWLRVLRPWWGHQDHFHVRLRCPADSPDCAAPQPLPQAEGCDASLDWWLSPDAASTAAKRKPPGEGAPAMPAKCEALLSSAPDVHADRTAER